MSVRAFFLPAADGGQRYCLHHRAQDTPRGAVLYVPPFGDEMNKARRMAALQARALAQHGIDVLQIDLLGCGDSSGNSGDARLAAWRDDLALGADWLVTQTGYRPQLLGLRLGALLALDFALHRPAACTQVIMWQPVIDGVAFVTALYRQQLAGRMLEAADGIPGTTTGGALAALRARVLAGAPLEVGGYLLDPALLGAIEALALARLVHAAHPLHWYDIGAAGRAPAPSTTALLRDWRAAGVAVHYQPLDGPPFWLTPEISTCLPLLAATVATALAPIPTVMPEPDHAI